MHEGPTSLAEGARLQARPPHPVPHLTSAETELYQALVSEAWTRVRRIEQERIPLPTAVERLELLTRRNHQGLPPRPSAGS